MRALFIQHDPGSRPGLVGAALRRRGYDVEVVAMSATIDDGHWDGEFPDVAGYDLVVPLGAVWSVYDRSKVGSWIDKELELLRAADRAGIPVLGICFGGQALAAAHGGDVHPAPQPEIGWRRIDTDDPGMVPPGPWMQWHYDRFTVPPEATELARTEVGPQAFVLRRNLALQFHPEVDADIIAAWVAMGGDGALQSLAEAGTDLDTVLADARREHARATADVERLLDGFLALVAA